MPVETGVAASRQIANPIVMSRPFLRIDCNRPHANLHGGWLAESSPNLSKYWRSHFPREENKDTEKLSNGSEARRGHDQRSG